MNITSQVRAPLTRVETELDVNYTKLNSSDWTLMAKVAEYLKPFADLTLKGSKESACISEVSQGCAVHRFLQLHQSLLITLLPF